MGKGVAEVDQLDRVHVSSITIGVLQNIDFRNGHKCQGAGEPDAKASDFPTLHCAIADSKAGGGRLQIRDKCDRKGSTSRGEDIVLCPQIEIANPRERGHRPVGAAGSHDLIRRKIDLQVDRLAQTVFQGWVGDQVGVSERACGPKDGDVEDIGLILPVALVHRAGDIRLCGPVRADRRDFRGRHGGRHLPCGRAGVRRT